MTQEQLDAAYALLNLLDSDANAQADAAIYGNWYTHLNDHLKDALTDDEEDTDD